MKEKCSYDCGNIAIKQFKNGKYCCSDSINKCPNMRKKNSEGINKNGVWNKGLTKYTDNRVLKYSNSEKITMNKKIENGTFIPWNKGLDKSDERVLKNIKNLIIENKKGSGSLQYNIDKYGFEIGTKKYYETNKKKKQTLSNYINKYGEYIGTIKYNNYINKKKTYFSKISQELFVSIDNINNNNSYFAIKNKEFGIKDGDKYYFYDYVDTKKKKVIEFNGDDFHANPKKYNEKSIPLKFINKTAKEIWNNDFIKNNKIISEGYDILIIWESEYKLNKEETIQKCIDFLYNKNIK